MHRRIPQHPRLSDKIVAAAKAAAAPFDLYDAAQTGLMVRVLPGRKTWSLYYYIRGQMPRKRQRLTLGTFPVLTTDQARAKALRALYEAGEGRDPSRLPEFAALRPARSDRFRAKVHAAPRSWAGAPIETVTDLVREFLARNAHKKTADEDQRIYYRELLGWSMAGEPLPGVAPADTWALWRLDDPKINWHRALVAIMRRKADQGKPHGARQLFAAVRHLLKWALGEGLEFAGKVAFEVNELPKPKKRDRYLNDREIPQVWAALAACDMEPNLKRLARFLLLTGQRSGEGRLLHTRELDREAGRWTLPAERTKNGLPHALPLTPAMLAILDEAAPVNGWVFPAKGAREPYSEHALSAAVARMRKKHLPDMPPFRPHDFRHTTNTGMGELGVKVKDAEAVHNHKKAGMNTRYNHAEVIECKRAALLRWQDHVEALVNPPAGGNVTALRRRT